MQILGYALSAFGPNYITWFCFERLFHRKNIATSTMAFIPGILSVIVTLQTMSEAMHISPYYLSHVFKQMSGYSPVQYLLRRRIGEAQALLITTDLSISRIAEMVGYDTQSYFNLQFAKNVSMPPNKSCQNYIVSIDAEEKPRRRGK